MCRAEHAEAVDQYFPPGVARRTHCACDRRQSRRPERGPVSRRSSGTRKQVTCERARAGRRVDRAKGYHIVSGGTDTHLMLVNLTNKGVTGKEADTALDDGQHHRQPKRRPLR